MWVIRCTGCPYYADQKTFDELGALFYNLESRGKSLWAWNREHLELIYKLLTGQKTDNDNYANLAVYMRREWLQGSRKRSWEKVIEKKM